jgi:hypothetical protein
VHVLCSQQKKKHWRIRMLSSSAMLSLWALVRVEGYAGVLAEAGMKVQSLWLFNVVFCLLWALPFCIRLGQILVYDF